MLFLSQVNLPSPKQIIQRSIFEYPSRFFKYISLQKFFILPVFRTFYSHGKSSKLSKFHTKFLV